MWRHAQTKLYRNRGKQDVASRATKTHNQHANRDVSQSLTKWYCMYEIIIIIIIIAETKGGTNLRNTANTTLTHF
jgi:hypothetical protein